MKIDPNTLKSLLNAISAVTDEATFHLTTEGVKTRSMDPSRVAMVDFELSKEAFVEYEVSEETSLCFDINQMLKFLRTTRKDETLELSLEELKLKLLFIKENDVREFMMPTLEASEEEVPAPKVTFNAKAKFVTSDLRQRLDDGALVSDMIQITASPDKIVIAAIGDLMTSRAEISKGSLSSSWRRRKIRRQRTA